MERTDLTIGVVVRMARQRVGLSTRELSAQAGLSASYVAKLESGEIDEPSLRSFARIARALSLTQSEIYFCVLQEGIRASTTVSPPESTVDEL